MKASAHASGGILILALGTLVGGGCERPSEGTAASRGAPRPGSTAPAAPDPDSGDGAARRADGGRPTRKAVSPLPFLGSDLDQDAVVAELRDARPRVLKPIGTASVVFQMRLAGPVDATFEPRTAARPDRYRHEVAAYRIARALRLDNVPPAVVRRLDRNQLRKRLHPDYRQVWEDIVRWTDWNEDDTVTGAAVFWSPQLRSIPLAAPRRMKRWLRWLDQQGRVPEDARQLAADLSTLVAFDYLIGHWKRFEDDRLQGPPTGRRIYFRHNHHAFAAPLPEHAHEDAMARLQRVERFSRRFVEALVEFDAHELRQELTAAPAAGANMPLLTDAEIGGVLERQQALLSYLGALIHEHGEQRILSLP